MNLIGRLYVTVRGTLVAGRLPSAPPDTEFEGRSLATVIDCTSAVDFTEGHGNTDDNIKG